MHGDLYRVSVHQCLDSLGLISVCQLIRCVNVNLDLSSGSLFHEFTELTSSISPGTCLRCGACKVPGCLRPVQITVILHGIYRILCKQIYKILCIVIAFTLKLLYKPVVDSVYCFLEGIDIHILFLCKGHTVALLPAAHDLLVAGTVDITLILNSLLACLINNLLLFRCQAVIDILVDTEEQTIIDCIPHGAVRLYLLYTGCVDRRQRVLLTLYRILLKCCVCLRPVHICGICPPSLIAFHKKVGTGHTNLQVLHVVYCFYFMLAVCQLTETILCDSHTMKSVLTKDLFQLFSGLTVKFCIRVIVGIIDKRQGYYIESRVKCRIDQIGMHGDLYRISVHQCLDSLGLISVCQLICCVNINLDFSAGCFFHKLTKLTSSVSPGTCFSCRACEVPCHLRPVKITVIRDGIKGITSVSGILGTLAFCVRRLVSCIGALFCKSLRKSCGNSRNISDDQKNCNGCSDHRHNCSGDLLKSNLQTFFDFDTNGNKKIYTYRRCYLSDRKVNCCHNTECYHIIAQSLTYRKHDRYKNVHRRVCINEASCDQENDVYDQKEGKLIMCNAGKKLRCRICNTKLGTYKREQGSTRYDQHDSTGCLCRIHKNVKQIFELNLTVDHHTNKQTVNNRYGCSLSWCKDTTVNSPEDDNRHQESPECIFKCIPAFFCGSFFTGWLNVMFLCLDHNDDHKSNTHQKSRNDTSHKHICNRYPCDRSVYNECDTRRYDNGDGTGGCHQCRGKRCGETALLNHSRDQNCSKCRNRCRAGTGDRSEEAGYDNTYNGDAALFMSYAGIYEVDQSFGNTGFCHNVSGQNKERDSKKQEFTDSGVHICSYDRQRCTGIKDGTYR